MSQKLEIKHVHSADLWLSSGDANPEHWVPLDRRDIYFAMELSIGSENTGAADIYQVTIATAEGLRRVSVLAGSNVVFERSLIVMSEYSWVELRIALQRIIDRCHSGSQTETQWKLQRYFDWEYEDFVIESRAADIAN